MMSNKGKKVNGTTKTMTNTSKEIKLVEDDIAKLESDIEERQKYLDSLLMRNKELQSRKSLAELDQAGEQLSNLILHTEQLSEVSIDGVDIEILETDENRERKKLFMTGSCKEIPFEIDFCILETLKGEKPESEISDLTVKVPDEVVRELSHNLQSVVNSQCVQGVFRMLMAYCKWQEHRNNVFEHFKDKYPDFVVVEETAKSDVLIITHPQAKQGPILTISWEFEMNTIGKVVPNVRLGIEVSKQILELDKKKTLESTPAMFRDMLEEFGVEYSIEVLVNLIKDQKDEN